MVNIVSSPRGILSPQQALKLANVYLENASTCIPDDRDIALVLCHDTEMSLSQAKKSIRRPEDQYMTMEIATAYMDLGNLLESQGHLNEAKASYKKAGKLEVNAQGTGRFRFASGLSNITSSVKESSFSAGSPSGQHKQQRNIATVPAHIFAGDAHPPVIEYHLPRSDERLSNTQQLAYCLYLLKSDRSSHDMLDSATRSWLSTIEKDLDEQDRLKTMATEVIKAFKRDELKDAKTVAEVVSLAPALDKDSFQALLSLFYSGIDHSGLLKVHLLEGLVHLIQSADQGHINAGDLEKILELLSRLRDTHQQSSDHMDQLTLAESHVLDAMADVNVTDVDRETLQESNVDDKKQAMHRFCRVKSPISYPLKVSQSELASPSLLDRVQNRPDVEGNIRLLRKQRTKDRGNVVYIPPQGKASLQAADDTRFPLMEKVKEFLESDKKVFLLMGDSGAGKSTFNRELELELWKSYKNRTGRIPLHINLPAIDKPEHDMIAKQLRMAEFTESQIREMKHQRKFILICDGYDESQQTHNLYMSNKLNQDDEWQAKMIISCRTEYLGTDYRDRFQPGDRNQQSDSSPFQEAVITLFSLDQVHDYIRQYVTVHQPLWEVDDYKQALERIPSLKDLVKNPFLMTLSLEVLPRMVDPGQRLSEARVTRVGLYDHFVEQWLERGKKRLGEKDLNLQARAAFESLSDEGFTQHGMEFMKNLAVAIYKEQDGQPIVRYSRAKAEQSWKSEFFSRDKEKRLLREACPLSRNGNQHRFIHRSLLEYALARAIFDPQDAKRASVPESVVGRRGSTSSTLSFEIKNDAEEQPAQEPDPNSPLVWRSFINDHSLLKLLEERVQQEPVFKFQLLDYIEHSKKDKKWRQAAANAITILVRAGEQFIGTDLKGIQIPGADLSYGVFDSVQLQNADLRKVNLRGVWLRQTDLSGAQMTGVQFGELPYLSEKSKTRSCAYSPDGNSMAVGLWDGDINVYSTSNWERTLTLKGHSNVVFRVVYSPTGDKIISASEDDTIRLWDMETGSQLHILKDHGSKVLGLAYSPQGDLIASGAVDMTVRLWDVITGDCRMVLSGHTGYVYGVVYSPSENQIASCSADTMIRLWGVATRGCIRILFGHSATVWDITYSPRGDQIASASSDKTVRLWNVETGSCLHTLHGHTNTVYSVAYSPKGDQVVSASKDAIVRFWDVETGSCRHTLTGHRQAVSAVSYSPKGDKVVTGSGDKTLRLWDASAGSFRLVSSGHSAAVQSIDCSPKGDLIVSGSGDNTIRLWDVKTGACRGTLSGNTETVFGVAFSPHGDWIASGCGDNSVRLWKVKSGECHRILTGHTDWVNSVTFSPEGDMIASTGRDKTVRLWEVATGVCRKTLTGHPNGILSVVYGSDGKQIATGSKDHTVRIWDAETGECCKILKGHTAWVREVAYSPQGDQLASASNDKTVRLWDVQTGESRMTLSGHTNHVWGIAYSANGKLLASSSSGKAVRLWDVSSGECRGVVESFPDAVRCVSWSISSDPNYLVTGCRDGSVLKWQVLEEDQCRVQLQWSASNGALTMTGTSIQGARGLTAPNKQLLQQRGAIGEPEHLFRETNDKLITRAVVVPELKGMSGLKKIPDGADEAPLLVADLPGEVPGPLMEQVEQPDQFLNTFRKESTTNSGVYPLSPMLRSIPAW
ncbi:MAG: WD40-repeat-containing domain protein [Benniella sp.]|nr:MAG: WD40-repeat-containing domain protein [Benniella sp.]